MTEAVLFQRALIALGATILAPLFVAATGLGGGDTSVTDHIKNYTQTSSVDKADDDKKADKSDKSDKDTSKKNDKSGDSMSKDGSSSDAMAKADYADATKAGTYTVKAGDTYGCIAEKYYGSYDQWSRVYAVNGAYPGFEEYTLNVGAKLQMPAVSSAQALPKTDLCQ